MNLQLDWEVFRYVLEDPTLDVADFESRMHSDIELALAVAAAVEQMEQLRQVCARDQASQMSSDLGLGESIPASVVSGESLQSPSGEATTGWHWISIGLLAAGLMLVVGAGVYSLRAYRDAVMSGGIVRADSQTFVDTWLALQQVNLLDDTRAVVVEDDAAEQIGWSTNEPSAVGDDFETVGEDWMLEAAREFYAQGVAS